MAQQHFVSDATEHKLRVPLEQKTHKTVLGASVHEAIYEDVIERVVDLPSKKYYYDYEQQADHLKLLTQ